MCFPPHPCALHPDLGTASDRTHCQLRKSTGSLLVGRPLSSLLSTSRTDNPTPHAHLRRGHQRFRLIQVYIQRALAISAIHPRGCPEIPGRPLCGPLTSSHKGRVWAYKVPSTHPAVSLGNHLRTSVGRNAVSLHGLSPARLPQRTAPRLLRG